MTSKCVKAYNVEVLRFTKVGPCGPIYGPCSSLIVDCFETLQINADIEDGEELQAVTANGNLCGFIPAKKLDRGFEIVTNLQRKYPNLFTMLNPNWQQVIDELGNITGYSHIDQTSLTTGVAIEGWESVAEVDTCTPGSLGQWNYFAIPYIANWSRNDLELGNSWHTEEWAGHTIKGNKWGTGPYNVRANASTGMVGKLQNALSPNSHFYDEVVTVAPPTASCECQPLSNPAGPALALTTCTPASMSPSITATASGGRPMQVNWGDGSAPASITSATPTPHTYTTPNRYIISVKYTDAAQEESYLVVTVPCP